MTIEWVGLGDAALILDTANRRVSLTNPVGRILLEMASEGCSRNAMVNTLGKRYEASQEQLAADVCAFFDGLQQLPEVVFQPADPYQPDTGLLFDALENSEPVQQFGLPGWQLRIRSCNAAVLSRLERYLPLAAVSGPAVGSGADSATDPVTLVGESVKVLELDIASSVDGYAIIIDGECVDGARNDDDAVFKALRFCSAHICRSESYTAVFHAAAVARGDTAVLLPGSGGQGKTTLCAYLVASGYQLINDDTVALLSTDNRLLPVPLPLSIKAGSWDVVSHFWPALTRVDISFADSNPLKLLPAPVDQWCTAPAACRLLVIPRYRHDAYCSRLEPLTPAQVLGILVAAGCFVGNQWCPDRVRELCAWLDATPSYRLEYSSLADAEGRISALLEAL